VWENLKLLQWTCKNIFRFLTNAMELCLQDFLNHRYSKKTLSRELKKIFNILHSMIWNQNHIKLIWYSMFNRRFNKVKAREENNYLKKSFLFCHKFWNISMLRKKKMSWIDKFKINKLKWKKMETLLVKIKFLNHKFKFWN
jgi:hypothetical protein